MPILKSKGTRDMKTYRPYCSGFIILYVLIGISFVDAGWSLYCQITGNGNQFMQSFSFFSYLIALMGACYGWVYVRAKVCIDDKHLRIAFPANIRPADSTKRAMIIYRQGPNDLKLIDKTIELSSIERYGYVDDLGYSRVDQTGADAKSPMFPVKEVCFLTREGKRYHMNAAIYSKKQQKAIFNAIKDATGIEPEGSLKNVL